MFKKLSSALSRKDEKLNSYQEKTADLEAVFKSLLEELFGAEGENLAAAEYDDLKKEILIRTRSKAMASELSLHLGKITEAFGSTGLSFRRIVIR